MLMVERSNYKACQMKGANSHYLVLISFLSNAIYFYERQNQCVIIGTLISWGFLAPGVFFTLYPSQDHHSQLKGGDVVLREITHGT